MIQTISSYRRIATQAQQAKDVLSAENRRIKCLLFDTLHPEAREIQPDEMKVMFATLELENQALIKEVDRLEARIVELTAQKGQS